MSNNMAVVDRDVLSDGSVAFNVTYFDKSGYPVLCVGCITESGAEFLAESLNNAAWVQVDSGETVGR